MVSQLSEIWSGFSIPDPDPGSGSWLFTNPGSLSWITDPESRDQKGTGSLIPDPGYGFATQEISGLLRLQGVAPVTDFWRELLSQGLIQWISSQKLLCAKKILRIFYLNIISLIFTVLKLWFPAHLFPNTPRKFSIKRVSRQKIKMFIRWYVCYLQSKL